MDRLISIGSLIALCLFLSIGATAQDSRVRSLQTNFGGNVLFDPEVDVGGLLLGLEFGLEKVVERNNPKTAFFYGAALELLPRFSGFKLVPKVRTYYSFHGLMLGADLGVYTTANKKTEYVLSPLVGIGNSMFKMFFGFYYGIDGVIHPPIYKYRIGFAVAIDRFYR